MRSLRSDGKRSRRSRLRSSQSLKVSQVSASQLSSTAVECTNVGGVEVESREIFASCHLGISRRNSYGERE